MRDVGIEIVGVVAVLGAIVAILTIASRRGARRQNILDRARSTLKPGATIAVLVENATIGKVVELTLRHEKVLTASFPVTPSGFEAALKLHPIAIVARQDELDALGLVGFINPVLAPPMVLLQRPFRRPAVSGQPGKGIVWLDEPFDAVGLLGAVTSAIESGESSA